MPMFILKGKHDYMNTKEYKLLAQAAEDFAH
jgi:hypothetical protein